MLLGVGASGLKLFTRGAEEADFDFALEILRVTAGFLALALLALALVFGLAFAAFAFFVLAFVFAAFFTFVFFADALVLDFFFTAMILPPTENKKLNETLALSQTNPRLFIE